MGYRKSVISHKKALKLIETELHNQQTELIERLSYFQELADTLKAMQSRIAELVGRLAGESPLTGSLLQANDTLNNLLLRHSRFLNNR